MGRFKVDIELANYEDMILARNGRLDPAKVRRKRIAGVVDSGASSLVLPREVVEELGLPTVGSFKVRYADERSAKRNKVKDAWLQLLGRDGVFSAVVEPKRKDALIGAIVMEELDLVDDCKSQRLYPRDPKQIIVEIG
jgi:predicted aspartyl protease